MRKKMHANNRRYRVDTYCMDGVYNDISRNISYHSSLKSARQAAKKQEELEYRLADHSMIKVWSNIGKSNRQKYRYKRKKR